KIGMAAHLGAPCGAAGGHGGDGGVDFDDYRAALRQGIHRPDRQAAGQTVKQAHAGEARLADLGRADEVEIGIGPAAHGLLSALGQAEAAAAARFAIGAETVAFAAAVAAEVTGSLWMIDEAD